MAEVKKAELHMEKRDMDAIIRFLNNLKAQGVLDTYLRTNSQTRFEYWPDAQRVEVFIEN